MNEQITIGEAARILDRPRHQAQRAADQISPNLPRVARARGMPREQLCELAAALERRYGSRQAVAS
jgi:hypothetical protein